MMSYSTVSSPRVDDPHRNFYECGLYIAVNILPPSRALLAKFMHDAGLGMSHQFHVSVLSTHSNIDIKMSSQIHQAHFDHYDIFKSRSGNNVLVAKLNSPTLVARHHEIVELTGAHHDFHDYVPHITLSYSWDHDAKDLRPIDFPIFIGEEYCHPQDVVWSI